VYEAAPYEDMTTREYNGMKKRYSIISLDLDELIENTDDTIGSQEYACVAGACEI
jgi:hypothetical protein